MNHNDIINAIQFIRPNAQFTLTGDKLDWLDANQVKPTKAEIEAGWVAYQAAHIAEIETKANARTALLERLGITEDEAKLLLS
jgi:hypothetical protein